MLLKVRVLGMSVLLLLLVSCGGGGGGSTGGTPPPAPQALAVIFATFPDGTVGVVPDTTIALAFNTNVNAQGVSVNNLQLFSGATAVPIKVELSGANATVTPLAPLKTRADYRLTLKAGATAVNGGALPSDYTLNFRTAAAMFEAKDIAPPERKFSSYPALQIAAADLNGDGRPDIVQLSGLLSTQQSGLPPLGYTLNILIQNSSGGFDKMQELPYVLPQSNYTKNYAKVVLLDIDGDGAPEIIVPEYQGGSPLDSGLRIYKRGSDGQFAFARFMQTPYAQTLDALDVDGDGRLDLIGSGSDSDNDNSLMRGFQVFMNTGMALLPSLPIRTPANCCFEFAVADLDRDGNREIIVSSNYVDMASPPSFRLLAYRRDGSGGYSETTQLAQLAELIRPVCEVFSCSQMKVLDLNGDGWPDFLFGRSSVGAASFVRQPNAGYVKGFEVSLATVQALFVADADRDGIEDLMIVGNNANNFVAVAFGNGNGRLEFSPAFISTAWDSVQQEAAAVVDIDGDGLPDILYTSVNTGIGLMRQLKY